MNSLTFRTSDNFKDLVMDVLKSELARACNAQRPIFIQGFPRDVEQAARYEDDIMPIRHAFFINTSEAYSKKHMLQWNKYAARFEDNEEIIHKRRRAFRRDAMPLLENLARKHRVIEVDGNKGGASVFEEADEIFQYWLWQLKSSIASIKKPRLAAETEDQVQQRKKHCTPAEMTMERTFPSVHYSGPTYNGHV
ncbi:hypothetical protein RvY_19076 [Ramazzottius varieornatus]|uniref:Uncharacterized protein n=1 Tax=Ramazzottius varieornatus TaxID=947166 RepID=A0A1D1WC18_RAMVA|nr:hypothetical protein RvY_19076 [Ramazzottius varieornatus]